MTDTAKTDTATDTAPAPVQIRSYTLRGITAVPVTITVSLVRRLPRVVILGLPANAVQESAERVRSAITAAGWEFPRQRVMVDVSPVDLPKTQATIFDLPIAVGILIASGGLPATFAEGKAFVGELSLNGELRPHRGALAMAEAALAEGRRLVCPHSSFLAAHANVMDTEGPLLTWRYPLPLGLYQLANVVDAPDRGRPIEGLAMTPSASATATHREFADIQGNLHAVDAVVEAAATGKTLLLIGPPGCGRSMIARRFADLLDAAKPLSWEAHLEVLRMQDAAGLAGREGSLEPVVRSRPFRAPHHTCSASGLLGDRRGRPGECSLANRGVLFLDEAGEFPRANADLVRAVFAKDVVCHQALGADSFVLPAAFHLVLATNPDQELRVKHHFPGEKIIVRLNAIPVEQRQVLGDTERWPSTAALAERVCALRAVLAATPAPTLASVGSAA